MSGRQYLYSVDAAFNRVKCSGDDMSSESGDGDDFVPTVTPKSDATNFLESRAQESEGPSKASMFIVRNIYYKQYC